MSTQNRSLPELDGIGIETAPAGQSWTGAARPQSCAGSRERTWQLEENTAAPPRRGLPADSNAAQGYLAAREPKGVRDGKAARLFQRLRADPEVWLGQQGSQIVGHFCVQVLLLPGLLSWRQQLALSEEAERMFLDRVASSPLGYGRTCLEARSFLVTSGT